MKDPVPSPAANEPARVWAARRGDRAAFIALARAHQRAVYRVVFSLIRDREPARRVAIETLVRAWRVLRELPESSAFDVWLLRLARNLALAHQRRSSSGRPAPAFTAAAPPGAHPASLERCEAAFAALTPEHQHALALRVVVRMSYADLAKVLDIPPAVAVSRVSGARATMLARLGGPELLQ